MIKPTVGRVVWFFDNGSDTNPKAAMITHVPNDDRKVDLIVFRRGHVGDAVLNVTLVQAKDETVPGGPRCEWMPYQKGQAAKTEMLEAAVKAAPVTPTKVIPDPIAEIEVPAYTEAD